MSAMVEFMSCRCIGLMSSIALTASCSAHLGNAPADANGEPDAAFVNPPGPSPDAGLGAWEPAAKVAGAATNLDEDDVTLSSSATELIYGLSLTATDKDLYIMKRASATDAFGPRAEVKVLTSTLLNTAGIEETPRLSADDLTLYFGKAGAIMKITRTSTTSAWSAPTAVAGITAPARWYTVCGNRFMVVRGTTDLDLYEGAVGATPTAIAALNTAKVETSPFLSSDCLTLYFASDRSGASKIYLSTRESLTSAWSAPVLAPSPINDGSNDQDPWISADQRLFIWASVRNGSTTKDLYMTTR